MRPFIPHTCEFIFDGEKGSKVEDKEAKISRTHNNRPLSHGNENYGPVPDLPTSPSLHTPFQ